MRAPTALTACLFLTALLSGCTRAPPTPAPAPPPPAATILFTSNPNTWQLAGKNPADYSYASDEAVSVDGLPAARFGQLAAQFSSGADPSGITRDSAWAAAGNVHSNVSAFRGQRVRMRGKIKTASAAVGAAIWFRIDSAGKPIALCNMIAPVDRRIAGTQDFTSVDCVLDVPSAADTFAFGAMLGGPGTAWYGLATFEQVGTDVPDSPRAL